MPNDSCGTLVSVAEDLSDNQTRSPPTGVPNEGGLGVRHFFSTVSLQVFFGEHRNFKFGRQVDHIKFQPMEDKLFLRGAWSHHVTYFEFVRASA